MFKFATIIIAAAATVSAPALAEKYEAKVVKKNGDTYYCVKQPVTSSLIPARVCVTEAELTAQGAEIASINSKSELASNAPASSNQN
ncbi:hypothetical protein FHS91_003084 [Sphingobium xanthum]|jgi:hypothetical protein|uniref:hypothetical protein n=1 Tax=Sphingobium xanthum TaxID=1387165 RepID=UPI001C8CCECB|nr:hypothetical protein [Sphingobium xanthum]